MLETEITKNGTGNPGSMTKVHIYIWSQIQILSHHKPASYDQTLWGTKGYTPKHQCTCLQSQTRTMETQRPQRLTVQPNLPNGDLRFNETPCLKTRWRRIKEDIKLTSDANTHHAYTRARTHICTHLHTYIHKALATSQF